MNWPVDGKGIRRSTNLGGWIAPWMGKVSGSQRNLGKMDDLEKNKSDKSQRGAWKWMIWRRVSLTKVNGIHEKGWLRLRKLAWKSLKQELEDDSVCGSGVPGQPNLWRRAGDQENNSRVAAEKISEQCRLITDIVTNRMKNSGTSSPYDREDPRYFYILRYYLYEKLLIWNTRRIFLRVLHKTKFPSYISPRGCKGTGKSLCGFSLHLPVWTDGLQGSTIWN